MWLLNFDSVTHAGAKASHLPPSFDRFLLSLFFFFFKAQSKTTLAAERDSGVQEGELWREVPPDGGVAQPGCAPPAPVTPD